MQLPIVFLCIVSAVSAAPQLFFVVPQQFLDNPTQQNFQNFIPLIVPFTQQQSEAVPVIQDAPAAVAEALIQTELTESVSEAAPEATAVDQTADVAAVAAEEPAPVIESEPISEVVAELQPIVEEPVVEEVVPQEPATENEVVPKQDVEIAQDVATVSETAVPETEQLSVDAPVDVAPVVQEAIPETAPITEGVQETSIIAEESPAVQTNQIDTTGTAESPKVDETQKIDTNSGKSFNSISSPNTIHHSIVTHFGFRSPASVKDQPITFTHHGAVVDPKTLVPQQFRHFIYQNDSPDVVAAKIAFFRVQAALTPTKAAKFL